jgi:hypothetical protein
MKVRDSQLTFVRFGYRSKNQVPNVLKRFDPEAISVLVESMNANWIIVGVLDVKLQVGHRTTFGQSKLKF